MRNVAENLLMPIYSFGLAARELNMGIPRVKQILNAIGQSFLFLFHIPNFKEQI